MPSTRSSMSERLPEEEQVEQVDAVDELEAVRKERD
jgi:hypothetical protein